MLNQFFYPKSIVIIGASKKKKKVSYDILKNVIQYGWKGEIYLVNPETEKIFGRKCFRSVLDIPKKIDLGIIIVPAKVVPQVLEECGKKKISSIIIISAGFRETGLRGRRLEREIKKIIKEHKIKILGPNCLGIINTQNSLNLSFAQTMPKRGNIGLIFQSGALVSAFLEQATENNLGFSKIITLGNKVDLTENEALEYLSTDPLTSIILIFLEDFINGKKFIEIMLNKNRLFCQKKPVILFKAGRTKAGKRAAISHTGALAGSDEAVSAALKKVGIIQAETLEDFLGLAKALSWQSLPKNNKIAIITNAGGPGTITADAIERKGALELANLELKTINSLKKFLPPAVSLRNPIDLLGDALKDRYEIALEAVLKDRNVNGIIVILTPQTMTEKEETAEMIGKLFRRYWKQIKKPVLASFMGGERMKKAIEILAKNKIPNYDYPEKAIEIMGKMWEYYKRFSTGRFVIIEKKDQISKSSIIRKQILDILRETKEKRLKQVDPFEAEKILKFYKIPVIKSYSVKSLIGAIKLAKKIGYPVVLKSADPRIIHKTEKEEVRLNLKTKKELRRAYQNISQPKLMQKMISRGKEVIIGMRRDPWFGPLIMFGLGGIFVEVLKDVSFCLVPLKREEAKEMISEIKGYKILRGFRKEKASDINSLINLLLKLSRLSLDFPEIKEIDLNPVRVFEKGKDCICLDVKILV